MFDNWKLKDFALESYLNDSVDTAYKIDLRQFNNFIAELKKIEPQGSKIEALYCPMWSDWYDYDRGESVSYKECINLLLDAHQQLINLKALFFADETGDRGERRWEYKRYKIDMDEVCYLLEAYPNLEVLHLLGRDGLEFSHIKQNHLKTLVIETRRLRYQTLKQINSLDLPKLEYLELWLGEDYQIQRGIEIYNETFNLNIIESLLYSDYFPNLKYLGLCSCEWANDLVNFLKDTPILKRLRILNLSRGTLTDEGAEILLNCPAINQLHTLDVSMNLLSPEMIDKLSKLDCNVITEPQDIDNYQEGCGRHRYSALYE